ncbi:alpha-galactosidase [Streptomyces viridiviolaceus]|uniref:Alpha-galactosidase n=1 Tax=Streptomyces viridiviolaceus TaxID=68282 RepID=A0ABW2E9U9_9ACTN|nr:alpha-galactosidase [Streptomyces viridiviolaceus]GHB78233.1 alpha-galactosidase [Streptomyces viridiviolaceus]
MPMISRVPDTGLWVLSTPRTSYVLRVDDTGAPRHVAWGPQLTVAQAGDLLVPDGEPASSFEGRAPVGEELPVDGGTRYGPPSLQVRYADGSRAFEWQPTGHRVLEPAPGTAELVLEFRDRLHPVHVALHYTVREDTDVIERHTVVRNAGESHVDLLRADSAAWSLPALPDYRISHVTGQWAAESRLRREPLPHGETVLTSRRGITSHHASPWVMLDDGDAGEEHGRVWSAALAWSGSWRVTLQRTHDGRAGFTGGVGHDGTSVPLAPGEEFTSPVFAGLFTDGGFGAASRAWHAYTRAHVLPHAWETAPVLYNSWEATGFDVDEASQLRLAERAAALGVELYVVDDGWFGTRRDDHAGLGDWTPAPKRFPRGLGPLADRVHGLGMRFGVWVEPEMVNPDSDLYRAHPDWVLHIPGRTRSELRNQLVLNFARDDVADWAHDWLARLVAEAGVDFLKWDMNRAFSEAGWSGQPDGHDRLWTGYVHNLYGILDRLRADHPGLRVETCSGGGGRADLGILRRTDQAWTSDNTDAVDRLVIQDGFGQVLPARVMSAWVTDVPNQFTGRTVPLRYRFHAAMAGLLGIGGDLNRWSQEELAEGAELVAEYKRVRHLVQHGDLYRPAGPRGEGPTVVQYSAGDGAETLVLAWRRGPGRGVPDAPVRLRGLTPGARYRDARTGAVHHAAVLEAYGLRLGLPVGDWSSTAVHLVRVADAGRED